MTSGSLELPRLTKLFFRSTAVWPPDSTQICTSDSVRFQSNKYKGKFLLFTGILKRALEMAILLGEQKYFLCNTTNLDSESSLLIGIQRNTSSYWRKRWEKQFLCRKIAALSDKRSIAIIRLLCFKIILQGKSGVLYYNMALPMTETKNDMLAVK